MKTILVTGATGSLGRAAAAALTIRGFTVTAASRHPDALTVSAITPVRFDFDDRSTYQPALRGAEGLLLIAPPLDVEADRKLNPFIDRAKETGVRHIVLNSALGVDASEDAPLRKVERHLMASGVSYTILRPNFFMENFTTGFLAPMVKHGEISLAAGDGKTSFISVRDIAAVAVEAFSTDHNGRAYNLTGPAALDHAEAARIISKASGKTVTYHSISDEEMIEGAKRNGLPESAAGFMAMLYGVVRNGWAAGVTDDVRQVTGRQPVSFEEFAMESARAWRGEERSL